MLDGGLMSNVRNVSIGRWCLVMLKLVGRKRCEEDVRPLLNQKKNWKEKEMKYIGHE